MFGALVGSPDKMFLSHPFKPSASSTNFTTWESEPNRNQPIGAFQPTETPLESYSGFRESMAYPPQEVLDRWEWGNLCHVYSSSIHEIPIQRS